ncbi:MAG TPA: ABC transporter ATP-binding protein [Streptosporangiaceae bacterium]|nr:ABC transporter ATP-binding protein [Streptosporangiaceae bacterium]
MTQNPSAVPPATGPRATGQAWRGIAAEDVEDVPASLASLLRLRGRRLLQDLLRPHRATVGLILLLIVIANLAALAGPWLVGIGIDRIPRLARSHDAAPLALVIAAFAVAVIAQAAATRSYIAGMGRLGADVVLELRRRLFAHFLRLPVSFHERYTSGRVISRQVSDIDSISDLFDEGLDSLVSAALSLLLVGAGMLLLDWPLALVVLAGFGPLTWLTAWFRRESGQAYRRTRETIAQVIVHFVETFGGIRAVQAFRRERRNEEIFGELNAGYAAASLRSSRLIAIYSPGISLVGNLAIGAVLLYGGLRVIDGGMKIGVLVTFLLYLQRFFDPLQDLAQFYNTFQSAAAALEKISGVLDEAPAVAEPEHPAALPDLAGHGGGVWGGRPPGPDGGGIWEGRRPRPAPARGGRSVQFESVRFGYRDAPVLRGLDLTIPAGQTAALVGTTGAGKTTIARLMARFYDPGQGRVLLDGVDLRQLDEPTLRREVIMITQENFLFSGTVAENIALGRPGASRAEIEAAALAIGAHEFIAALPAGYDEPVGKRGGRLSAGQRQLISFTRAFLAAPAVLVLDEATSLLDIPSERLVQRALRTILAGRTALIIAHRLSTVQIADRVLVISDGAFVEDGPPGRLLAEGGEYSALHASWLESLA